MYVRISTAMNRTFGSARDDLGGGMEFGCMLDHGGDQQRAVLHQS